MNYVLKFTFEREFRIPVFHFNITGISSVVELFYLLISKTPQHALACVWYGKIAQLSSFFRTKSTTKGRQGQRNQLGDNACTHFRINFLATENISTDRLSTKPLINSSDSIRSMVLWIPSMHLSQVMVLEVSSCVNDNYVEYSIINQRFNHLNQFDLALILSFNLFHYSAYIFIA